MPGQALLKATLLKETYVPLVDLNGAERKHGVVRVLPSRLSIMERRLLDQIAPKVFPVSDQLNTLRQAARLQEAGFRVKDLIDVYERLLAKQSEGYTYKLAPADEYFEFSPTEVHQLVSTPKLHTDDLDSDRSAKLIPISSPEETLKRYRNAIFESIMSQFEDKCRVSVDHTKHSIGIQNEENRSSEQELGRTPSVTIVGGVDGGKIVEHDVISRSVSSEASDRHQNLSPKFHDHDSLEVSFEISEASQSSVGDTTESWRWYLGSYPKSPSNTISSDGTLTLTPSSIPTTRNQIVDSPVDRKMPESTLDTMIEPTVGNEGGQADLTRNGEQLHENSNTRQSLRPNESSNSLRKLLAAIDEDDDVREERSLMSILRATRGVDDVTSQVVQRNRNHNDSTDVRDLHSVNVEKSGSDGAGVEATQVSPSGWSEVSVRVENSTAKFHGDGQHRSAERSSEIFAKCQSIVQPSTIFSEARQDFAHRGAGVSDRVQNSSAKSHGDSQHPSHHGRISPSFLRSLSMNDSTCSAQAREDSSSTRAGVSGTVQISSPKSEGGSQHRPLVRASPTFLRSLSMNESAVFAEAKQDFSGRRHGVPDNGLNSSDKSHCNSQRRSLGRLLGKSQSMREVTRLGTAVKQDFSAASSVDSHGSLEGSAERLGRSPSSPWEKAGSFDAVSSQNYTDTSSLPTRTILGCSPKSLASAKLSLASKTIEVIMRLLGRSPSETARLQPITDSTAREKARCTQEQSQERICVNLSPTLPRDHDPVHDNNGSDSSLRQMVHGNDVTVVGKHSGQKLHSLLEDERDLELEILVKTNSDGSCSLVRTVKKIFGCHKGSMPRIKIVSAWFHGIDWTSYHSKVGEPPRSTDETPPKRSFSKRAVTLKRTSSRSPRSTTRRTMMSPKRKADRARHTRKPVKPVGSTADEFKRSRSQNRSGSPTETTTIKVHPIGGIPEGRTSEVSKGTTTLAVTVESESTDKCSSADRNQTWPEQAHPILVHRQLRPRSTCSRFRLEDIARQGSSDAEPDSCG